MTEILLRHDSAGIATLTLNRPAARNALSMALMQALDTQLTAIAEDPAIKVVIIAANGPAFCARSDPPPPAPPMNSSSPSAPASCSASSTSPSRSSPRSTA
jgi:hypothetical protein